MRLIGNGAEARVYSSKHLGKAVIVKHRIRKKYRDWELDSRLRSSRTKQECLLMHRAKLAGVRTPVIYSVDRKGTRIVMEHIRGDMLRDALGRGNLGLCEKAGIGIARMHAAGIIHGDLTTSNMLLSRGNIAFVDFGLGFVSSKAEDRAVDLLVFRKTFNATHFSLRGGWERIIKGYLGEFPEGGDVVARLPRIEARARYAERLQGRADTQQDFPWQADTARE